MEPTTPPAHDSISSLSALIMIVVASIGTDRIVSFGMGILSKVNLWNRFVPNPHVMEEGPERDKAMKRVKGIYSIGAGLVGGVGLAWLGNIHILHMLGFDPAEFGVAAADGVWLDCVMTGLVFMVGAEKAQDILKLSGVVPSGHSPQAVDIAGTFLLDPDAIARADEAAAAPAAGTAPTPQDPPASPAT